MQLRTIGGGATSVATTTRSSSNGFFSSFFSTIGVAPCTGESGAILGLYFCDFGDEGAFEGESSCAMNEDESTHKNPVESLNHAMMNYLAKNEYVRKLAD